jgi:hypothetical protein
MKKQSGLGNKLIILDCADKKDDEIWSKGRNLANFPCPFRCILASSPNCGKSTVCKNIALQARPLYDRIVIVCCSKDTEDYNELEPNIVMDTLPSIESFDRKHKNLLIIDDYKVKTSKDKALLDRLFGFASSHCRTSILMCLQDLYALHSPTIRRMANVYIIWKLADENQLNSIGKRIGLGSNGAKVLKQIFEDLKFDKRDSLCIDLTPNSPAMLRKNLFEVIKTDKIPDLPT